jgi:uncharacterized membrane protein YphA (DoxX/SURF4 family)
MERGSRAGGITVLILSAVVAMIFLAVGGMKLASRPGMVHEFARIGLGQWFRYFTGALEVGGAIGVLVPRFRRWAAWLLAIVMVGATVANVTVLHISPALTFILLALTLSLAWLGN